VYNLCISTTSSVYLRKRNLFASDCKWALQKKRTQKYIIFAVAHLFVQIVIRNCQQRIGKTGAVDIAP